MLDQDIIVQLENLAVTFVSQSQYVGEMMTHHNITRIYGIAPVQVVRTDKVINFKDPEAETGFTVMPPIISLLNPYLAESIVDDLNMESLGYRQQRMDQLKTSKDDKEIQELYSTDEEVVYSEHIPSNGVTLKSENVLNSVPNPSTPESTKNIESFMANHLYNPLIVFDYKLLSDINIYEIDDVTTIFENFIRSVLHEFRHVMQFYEICRQMGSVELGYDMYERIIKYSNDHYPWPFTPLERDALNVMYTIDPFKHYYDGAIRDLIVDLINEVIDSEE